MEDHYANGTAPPTIKGLSTIVGFDGNIPDLRDITPAELPLVLAPMSDLQPVAMAETYLCSPARGNPTLHDVPAHVRHLLRRSRRCRWSVTRRRTR